jgi:hypothetical protein
MLFVGTFIVATGDIIQFYRFGIVCLALSFYCAGLIIGQLDAIRISKGGMNNEHEQL